MINFGRGTRIILLVVGLVLVTSLALWFRTSRVRKPKRFLGSPDHRERIEKDVARLGTESLEQSIQGLLDDDMYFYPGYHSPRKAAQTNLEDMFSNRRAVKVIEELGKLGASERAARCREAFVAIFEKHAEAFHTAIRHSLDPSAPKNKQSARASLLGLCALMFAAADAGRDDVLFEELARLDELRDELNRVSDRVDAKDPGTALFLARYSAPDNRFRLNMLRLAAARKAGEGGRLTRRIDEACAGLEKEEIPIVPWNADTTWFDFTHRHEGVEVDETRGVQRYEFYDWTGMMHADEDAQRELIQKVEALFAEG